MRLALALSFSLALSACMADPGPEIGAGTEALTYADSCVAQAFITTQNGSFVVGKVVGDGTSVRGHWLHLSEPGAAATCVDDDGDDDHDHHDGAWDDDDRGDHHGRWDDDDWDDDDHHGDDDWDDDEEHHGHAGREHRRHHDDGDDDPDDDECERSAPPRHVIVGHPTSLLCRPNGGFLAHVEGTASFDGAPGYTFALQLDDLSSAGLTNQYVMVVYDSTGAIVYSDPFDQVQTGRSSVAITGPPSTPTP